MGENKYNEIGGKTNQMKLETERASKKSQQVTRVGSLQRREMLQMQIVQERTRFERKRGCK